MIYSLSSVDRQKLGNVSKQIRAKLGGTDCRLVAIVYAIFVCQSVQKSSNKFPGLDSAFGVKLPDFLSDIYVTDYLLNSDTGISLEKQSLRFKVKRLIKDLAKANDTSIDLVHTDKLLAQNDDKSFTDWLEQSVEKLSFQLLLLENIAPPLELISCNPSLPAEVFNVLIKTSEAANDQTNSNTIPAELASLVAQSFPLKSKEVVLDLSFGLGNMIYAAMKLSEGVTFYGQESDSISTLLGWLRIQLTPSDNDVVVKVGDALTHGHELQSKMRPVDTAYLYSCSPWVVRDETKSLKNYDDEMVKKLISIKNISMERWVEADKDAQEIKAEINHHKSGLSLINPNNDKSQKSHLHVIESLEKKLARAVSIADQLKKEFEVTKSHLNSLRSSTQTIGARFGESRDSKLMKHALETVHDSGTVIATVSSRNLFSFSSLRLLNECLNKNLLDTVVELPRGSAGTNDRIAILVFRKNRKDKDVLFVDATKVSAVTNSSNEIIASVLTRRTKSNDFSEEFVTRLVDIIKNRAERPRVSIKVSFPSLESSDKSSGIIVTDLRPQKYLAESAQPKQSIESLYQSLDVAMKQTVESAKALQNARSELGLERLPTHPYKTSADRL